MVYDLGKRCTTSGSGVRPREAVYDLGKRCLISGSGRSKPPKEWTPRCSKHAHPRVQNMCVPEPEDARASPGPPPNAKTAETVGRVWVKNDDADAITVTSVSSFSFLRGSSLPPKRNVRPALLVVRPSAEVAR
jgi:hypothetical protein